MSHARYRYRILRSIINTGRRGGDLSVVPVGDSLQLPAVYRTSALLEIVLILVLEYQSGQAISQAL